jgi:hypothetical protein
MGSNFQKLDGAGHVSSSRASSGFLGIPLFTRRLNVWGSIMVLIWLLNFLAADLSRTFLDQAVSMIGLFLIETGFSIACGIKANAMVGKNYLEHGWEFAEPSSEATLMARRKWGLMPVEPAAPERDAPRYPWLRE